MSWALRMGDQEKRNFSISGEETSWTREKKKTGEGKPTTEASRTEFSAVGER